MHYKHPNRKECNYGKEVFEEADKNQESCVNDKSGVMYLSGLSTSKGISIFNSQPSPGAVKISNSPLYNLTRLLIFDIPIPQNVLLIYVEMAFVPMLN